MGPNLERLKELNQKLKALLDDPQPGLSSWQALVDSNLQAIALYVAPLKEIREALIIFIGHAYRGGFFAFDSMEANVRAWLEKNEDSIRTGVTVQQILEAIIAQENS